MADGVTVHIEELHDGRYIAWAVIYGDVSDVIRPQDDCRSTAKVYEEIGDLALDSGHDTVTVIRHRREYQ